MIIGNLNDTTEIEKLHPLFHTAFEWIRDNMDKAHELGETRIEIIPGELFVNIDEVLMKERTEQLIEVHKEYIDIHVPINKSEIIGWEPVGQLNTPINPYNEEKDRAFYCAIPSSFITANPGYYCIMTPEDGHAPVIGRGRIKKLCVQVKVNV